MSIFDKESFFVGAFQYKYIAAILNRLNVSEKILHSTHVERSHLIAFFF